MKRKKVQILLTTHRMRSSQPKIVAQLFLLSVNLDPKNTVNKCMTRQDKTFIMPEMKRVKNKSRNISTALDPFHVLDIINKKIMTPYKRNDDCPRKGKEEQNSISGSP